MNRILAVVASPRRNGNTHILVSRISEGAREKGAAIDELFLADLSIEECDGCHRCWEQKKCGKSDDMAGIYERIIDSDVIIFGTPVYWYGPTGLMKIFMDRFVYFNCPENREKIRAKRAVIAVPFEEENPEAARLVVEFFEKSLEYLEMSLVGRIIVGGVGGKGEIRQKTRSLQEAYELGRTLA
jgi:multimeric flavodoxin WrbA